MPVVDRDAYVVPASSSDGGLSAITPLLPPGDSAVPDSALIAPMQLGQRAPFPGVLFNGPALARVEVEFRAQQARCEIDRQAELRRVVAASTRDISLLETTIQTNERINRLIIRSRDEEIELLQNHIRTNQVSQNPPVWQYVVIGVGAALVGAGIAGTAVYFSRP